MTGYINKVLTDRFFAVRTCLFFIFMCGFLLDVVILSLRIFYFGAFPPAAAFVIFDA